MYRMHGIFFPLSELNLGNKHSLRVYGSMCEQLYLSEPSLGFQVSQKRKKKKEVWVLN